MSTETSLVQYLPLEKIFDGRSRFLIPIYQRGYSWQKDNWIDLWDDIYYLGKDSTHFTGQISVAKHKEENTYHVVDGQQRLTTVIILVKTLLDSLEDKEEVDTNFKSYWKNNILFTKNAMTGKIDCIFGYEKNDPSHEFFKTEILNINETSKIGEEDKNSLYNHNLKEAREFFKEQFKDMELEDKANEIGKRTFFQRLVKKLMFNFFVLPDEINTNIVFDTMNNRGLGLSEMEKLKNRLFYISYCEKLGLDDDIQNTYIELYRWLGKNKNLGLEADDFLRIHTTIYYDVTGKRRDYIHKHIYSIEKLRNGEFNKNNKGYEKLKKYIKSLEECIPHYYEMYAREKADKEEKWWDSLERLDKREKGLGRIAPLVLALWTKEKDSNKRAEFLKTLERFTFLRNLSSRADYMENENEKRAHKLYMKGEEPSVVMREIDEEINEKIKRNLESVLSSLVRGYDGDRDDIWYLLYEWDIHKRPEGINYDGVIAGKNHIEHIYPQDPSSEWKDRGIDFEGRDYQELVHHIGNLVLLTQNGNQQVKNESFDKKKEIYKNDTLGARYIANTYEDWNNQAIYHRGKELLEFFIKRWEIDVKPSDEMLDNVLKKKELNV